MSRFKQLDAILEKDMEDVVNNPIHYNKGKVECIEAIEAMLTKEEYLGYLRGNSFKYRWRMRSSAASDVYKVQAEWYDTKAKQFVIDNPELTEKSNDDGKKS